MTSLLLRRRSDNELSTAGDLIVDPRLAVSGCAGIALQQMTVNLRGELTLPVAKFDAVNGLRFVSADGPPHVVTVRVEGPSGSVNTDVTLQATTVDSNIRVVLQTPGNVSIHGSSSLNASIVSGSIATSGTVAIG